MEGGEVGRLGSVCACRSQPPMQPIGLSSEDDTLECMPQQQVLPNFVDAYGALNVRCPTVVE